MVALKVNIFLIKSFSPSPFKGRESTHKIKVLHDFFFLSLSPLPQSVSLPILSPFPPAAPPHSTSGLGLFNPFPAPGRPQGASTGADPLPALSSSPPAPALARL